MFSVPRLSTRFFLSIAFVVCLAAVILTGCDSNPAGSSASSTGTTNTASTTVNIAGTTTLYGRLLDLSTGNPIVSSNANVAVRLYRDAVLVAKRDAQNSNFYSFTGISGGIYYIEAYDKSGIYEKNYAVINLAANSNVEQNLSLRPKPGAAQVAASYTVIGKLVSAADSTPVMFADVSLGVGALTTSTLEDGSFILYGVSEGQYTVTFSKTGFTDRNVVIVASTTNLFVGGVAANNGTVADGAGLNVAGKNIGTIAISPAFTPTGALAGTIRNPTTDALVTNTKVALWYKPDNSDTRQPAIIHRPTTNAVGNVSIVNLPAGWYAITSLDTVTTPVYDNNGALVAYRFVGAAIYTGAFLQVTPPKTTTLPSGGL